MRSHLLLSLAILACLGVSTPAHAQAPIPGQPYQVPAGFEGYGPGTLISYGGYNYATQGDGTMLLQQAADSGSMATAGGPVADQPYQIPANFAGVAAGSLVTYGGSNYVIQSDGTMLAQQSAGLSADPSIGQPAYTYSSNYSQPGGGGYSGDPGGASFSSSSFQLGIGIYGQPGYPSQPIGQPHHPTYLTGDQSNHPATQPYHPGQAQYQGGQMPHQNAMVYRQGGQVPTQGGQVYRQGGQGFQSGGQGRSPSSGGSRPAAGGSAGGRPARRR